MSPELVKLEKEPVPPVIVAALTVPVKVGFASGALASRAACSPLVRAMVKLLFGTVTVPEAEKFAQLRVPVKVGFALFAFRLRAVWVAVLMGLFKSLVLSTSPRPTSDFVILLSGVGLIQQPVGACTAPLGVKVSPA